jgi:hypothetical protein
MTTLTFLFIIIFLLGLYFYIKASDPQYVESLVNNNSNKPRCPNLLIQKGSRFYLYNSKLAKVPGVNPIEFENLEDYTEFLDWQRSQNIRCPVLYLQETYDAQGKPVYKVRPGVSEPQGGLQPSNRMPPGIASSDGNTILESSLGTPNVPAYPDPSLLVDATRNDPPYNKNSYPAFDESSYYVGRTTPLDAMDIKQENEKFSPNPMDPNWGGVQYTQSLIDKGYYKDNNVSLAV